MESTGVKTLEIPLAISQISSANRLHERLSQWRMADTALQTLADHMPGFSAEICLLKSIAINSLYSTQVLAIVRMANHINAIFERTDISSAGSELIERIAALTPNPGDRMRNSVSFASKFCHFFVDAERFPIYDEAAREALKLHLGKNGYNRTQDHPYRTFCENFTQLKVAAQLTSKARELDRYLWITGMYIRWLKERNNGRPRVNSELLRLFEKPSRDVAADLDSMLPANIKRV